MIPLHSDNIGSILWAVYIVAYNCLNQISDYGRSFVRVTKSCARHK